MFLDDDVHIDKNNGRMGSGCTKIELCCLDNTVDSRIFGECKNRKLRSRLKQFVHLQTAIENNRHDIFDKITAKLGHLQVFLDDTRNNLTQKEQEFSYLLLNPLHKACFHHKIEFIKKFIENGVDLYRVDEKGRSPLEVLLRTWDKQHNGLGEKIRRENNNLPQEKLQALFESEYRAIKHNSLECFKLLINAYEDISLKLGKDKVTALHISLELNIPEVVEYLMSHGADIEAQNKDGNTPLILAAKHFNIWSMLALLEKGANANTRNRAGLTALHYCCMGISRSKHAIDLLVKYGADVNAQSNTGYTPLHHAALAEEYIKVHKLLYYDANPDVMTFDGKTVLYFLFNNINGVSPAAAMAYNHALCEMRQIRVRDKFDSLPYNLRRDYPGLALRFDEFNNKPRPLKQLALIQVKRTLGKRRQTPWHVRRLQIPHEIRQLILNSEEYNDVLFHLGMRVQSRGPRNESGEVIYGFPMVINLGYGLRWVSLD